MKNEWKILPEQETREKASDCLRKFNVTFVRWHGSYRGTKSELIAICPIHGEFKVSLLSVRYRNGGGCPKCTRITSPEKITEKVKSRCQYLGNDFLGFDGVFFGTRSNLKIYCPNHGVYKVGYSAFVHKFIKCPKCSSRGYDTSKPGTVYVLLNDEKHVCKVGISNDYQFRLHTLKRTTPFDFKIKYLAHFQNGSLPKMIEKMSHLFFKNAQLKGFDGCNEWVLYDDSVDEFFKRISET